MKKTLILILGLIVVTIIIIIIWGVNVQQSNGVSNILVLQTVELSSDKLIYLLDEEVILNLKISTWTERELDIMGFDWELYPAYREERDEKIFTIDFEGNFEIIEGDVVWNGIVSKENPKELVLKLKPLKVGRYSIAAFVETTEDRWGKREIINICIVEDLKKDIDFCAEKEFSANVSGMVIPTDEELNRSLNTSFDNKSIPTD